ncbi:TPA: hypothetical protein RZK30_000862 [Campylobacter coli]|nr:hypothetical protein [Campylobacter coli]HEB9323452.1 hypothetical protein [Campylobacter coli]
MIKKFLTKRKEKKRFERSYKIIKESGLFDVDYYFENYPDVKATGIDPVRHYLMYGWQEGRNPNDYFDTEGYLKCNLDVKESSINPFIHYILHGKNEKRYFFRTIKDENINRKNPYPNLKAIPIPLIRIKKRYRLNNKKVGVFLHVYYVDLMDEIMVYLKNIPFVFDLYISTDSSEKKEILKKCPFDSLKCNVEIRVFKNKGRDIAPFIVGFADKIREVDFGVHIHTKKSLHFENGNCAWRNYLYDELLGNKDIVLSHLEILENKEMGITYPSYHNSIINALGWGHDFKFAKLLFYKHGIVLDNDVYLEFPAGSMFWFKSSALNKLLDLELTWSDFPEENGQIDGTIMHGIERTFLMFAELAGYKWCMTKVSNNRLIKTNQIYKFGNRIVFSNKDYCNFKIV